MATYPLDELFNNLDHMFVELGGEKKKDIIIKCPPAGKLHSYPEQPQATLMALMAALVIDIIFARDIGGFMSIMENN